MSINPLKPNLQSGQAMLLAVLFFLAITTTIVLGTATPILKQVKISNDTLKSKTTYYLTEGALEDALYRLKNNKNIVSGDTVVVNGYTSTITITTTSSGKTIETLTNRNGIVRKMQAQVIQGVGTAFNYGLQTGVGGFTLSGGSTINGNVYSNGPIVATNGVTITGSAIAANSSALASDQSNITPTPISSCTTSTCISYRNVSASQDVAQSFRVSTTSPLNKIRFYVKKNGIPSDSIVRIVTDSGGSPSTNNILSINGTLLASQVSGTFGWVDVVFADNPALDPDVTYWVVLDNNSQHPSNNYQIGANTSYANGVAKVGAYNGTWNNTSPAGLDMYFDIYLGGFYSTLGGGSYVGSVNIGTAGIGDAWAHTVSGASVAGNLYCVSGTSNNKSCNTSRADPSPVGFPISEANIQEWKDQAEEGWTYNGNLTIGYQGTTTGPLVVNGNLIVNGGGLVTLTGTIWVKGNVTFSSGAGLRLSSAYGNSSGVLISDGYMTLTGGTAFSGSGQAGSYPLLLTTSSCPVGPSCAGNNALELSGGSGAVVLNAQEGTLRMSGGTSAKSLTAKEIIVDGGGSVTYEAGLANLNFSSGPSGGWNISSWKEVQ